MEVEEGSDQKSDMLPHWMTAHVRLKYEFTENEKCHNLMSWLICGLTCDQNKTYDYQKYKTRFTKHREFRLALLYDFSS